MQNKKILVIEDNSQNTYLLTFLLEKEGFCVLQADNGNSGLKKAEKDYPDLILLDIQLPVMDGYEVASRLKKNPVTEKIPIIAVTSYAMPGDKEKAISSGCDGYIEKPIDPDIFISQIEPFFIK